ncbi:MAG: thiopeptide-type bacteriocin biosynthesis protein [Pseudonocardia sp.]|nr:thiopeptide-type bacteriocin biosynthesis protein [Pseudonocardia sp.]
MAEVIGPSVRELGAEQWFFIRYWQAGPHVRLRVRDLDARSVERFERGLQARLATAGALAADEPPLDEAAYRDGARRFAMSELGQTDAVEDLRAPGVYRAEYVPEVDRYGGPELTASTERLFHLSSELVLALLPDLSTPRARSVIAIRGTISAAAALGDRTVQAHFYAESLKAWRSWAADFGCTEPELDRLCEVGRPRVDSVDPNDHGIFADWNSAIADLAAEAQRTGALHMGRVVFSHVHMLHNRIGRSLFEELATYAWLARVFPVT